MHKAQRLINHVALVLDGSGSMSSHKRSLIQVADEQIRYLAVRSEELSQETRVSVYLFDDRVECLIFDMDVMRLPSIADLYKIDGTTALIDAFVKSQDDLKTTSQIYGDHAFLTFVLTDGGENASKTSWTEVPKYLQNSGPNWSTGFLVPNSNGVHYMKRLGADEGSIAIWDTNSARGIVDAVSAIRTATDNFMTNRASGIRGTRTVFSTGVDAVNKATVSTTLTPLDQAKYAIYKASARTPIKDFYGDLNIPFKVGTGYYQLTKAETIQAKKKLVVVDKKSGKAYAGDEARHLVGLPDGKPVRVKPDYNPDYDIFVQSTSNNRVLLPGTRLLIL